MKGMLTGPVTILFWSFVRDDLDKPSISNQIALALRDEVNAFEDFAYPNEIGPRVYDIHSPNVPDITWIKSLIHKAAKKIPVERLWVNPDCGLKTRGWEETRAALDSMVKATKELRKELG